MLGMVELPICEALECVQQGADLIALLRDYRCDPLILVRARSTERRLPHRRDV